MDAKTRAYLVEAENESMKKAKDERRIISETVARRYVNMFGGKIAYLTYLSAHGLFHTLTDKHGNRIAIVR